MALQSNSLVTLAEAKAFLTIKGTEQDPLLETVINAASDSWEKELNRPVKEAVYTNLRLIGPTGPKLYLRASPINLTPVPTVKVGEITQTIWKAEADGDPATFDVLVMSDVPEGPLGIRNHLYRQAGWKGSNGQPYNVLITYTGGFNPVPSDLKDGVLYVIQKLFRDRQKQLADVQTVTLPSGSITLFDMALPRWAMRVLDKYRWIPVG